MPRMSKTALLAGASGLTGAELIRQLLDHPAYDKVISLGRRPLPIEHPKLVQHRFNFEQPDLDGFKVDDVYCALGTTLRKAGSQVAQYQVDHDYPLLLAQAAKACGARQYMLVSSISANANSRNFYLRTKGTLERDLQALGFDSLIVVRPSFLFGPRQEFRLGEKIGIGLAKLFAPLIPKKYRGIHVQKVANALISNAQQNFNGLLILESDRLHDY